MIVDDPYIQILNQQYLNHDYPTNVISFPMREGEYGEISPNLLGDVVISADTAQKEAKEAGINMEDRITQLLVHGVLHLFGFDHENNEDEATIMETKSNELLTILNQNGVYNVPCDS